MSSSLLSRGRSVSPPEDRRDPRAGRREPRRVRVVGREARMEVVSGAAPRRPAPFWRVVTIRTVLIDDRHLTPRIADLHFFLFCILTSSSHRLASLPQVGDNIKGADCNGTISFSQVIFKPHPFNNITCHREPKRDQRRAKGKEPKDQSRKPHQHFLRGSMSALSFPELPGDVRCKKD